MRPSVSDVPPAANGAMNLTVRAGQACAWPWPVAPTRPSATKASSIIRFLIIFDSPDYCLDSKRLTNQGSLPLDPHLLEDRPPLGDLGLLKGSERLRVLQL